MSPSAPMKTSANRKFSGQRYFKHLLKSLTPHGVLGTCWDHETVTGLKVIIPQGTTLCTRVDLGE